MPPVISQWDTGRAGLRPETQRRPPPVSSGNSGSLKTSSPVQCPSSLSLSRKRSGDRQGKTLWWCTPSASLSLPSKNKTEKARSPDRPPETGGEHLFECALEEKRREGTESGNLRWQKSKVDLAVAFSKPRALPALCRAMSGSSTHPHGKTHFQGRMLSGNTSFTLSTQGPLAFSGVTDGKVETSKKGGGGGRGKCETKFVGRQPCNTGSEWGELYANPREHQKTGRSMYGTLLYSASLWSFGSPKPVGCPLFRLVVVLG